MGFIYYVSWILFRVLLAEFGVQVGDLMVNCVLCQQKVTFLLFLIHDNDTVLLLSEVQTKSFLNLYIYIYIYNYWLTISKTSLDTERNKGAS